MAEGTERLDEIKQNAGKRKRRRAIIITVAAVLVIAAVIVGTIFFIRYRTYNSYSVSSSIDLGVSSDNLSLHKFGDGYIQCTGDGIIYFDSKHVLWSENFEMSQPVLDICGDYIAVADMKQSDIYIYDKSGLYRRISSKHEIIDVEISSAGMVALATNDNDANFIELKDKEGNDIINAKSVFSASGYLTDITLAPDGKTLAAAFNYVSQGMLESKVLFYDFSGDKFGEDMLVGGFNQYEDTLLTNVEFLGSNTVCAVGDNALSFYSYSGSPSVRYEELDIDWEIQSLHFTDNYVMIIIRDNTGDHTYRAKVYSASGEVVAEVGFDFTYNKAAIAGKNILLYSTSSSSCRLYAFSGIERFAGSFSEPSDFILPNGSRNFILTGPGKTSFIQLR